MSGSATGLRRMLPPSYGVPKPCAAQLDGSAAPRGAAVMDADTQLLPQGAAGVMGCGVGLPLQLIHE